MIIDILKNNNYIGVDGFEIISIPEIEGENISAFERLLDEFHRITINSKICIELMWTTDSVKNQTFRSVIRIFCVFRMISNQKDILFRNLSSIIDIFKNAIISNKYVIEDIDEDRFTYIRHKRTDAVFAIAKKDKIKMNMSSIYPYYYTNVFPIENKSNFNDILNYMCEEESVSFSIQLFPTNISGEENAVLEQYMADLSRISSGVFISGQMYKDAAAQEPYQVIEYINNHKRDTHFQYNILVYGEKAKCIQLSAKIMSHIKDGNKNIGGTDLICIDLSNEHIDISKGFSIYPWNANTLLLKKYRDKQIIGVSKLSVSLSRMPFIITSEEAAGVFRLPKYEKEMVMIRPNLLNGSIEQFNEDVVKEDNIRFGNLVGSEKVLIGCPGGAFTKHALIVGTPGSGKTTFSVNLLLQFARKGIPFLAIEPTKTEYRAMIDALPMLQVFTPGNNLVSPFILNPFIPPKGVTIEQYIPSLASAFQAAFSMPTPLDMIFLKAVRTCYIEYGWKDYSKYGDEDVTVFGLYEFILTFKKIIEGMNYSKDVKGNIESGGLLRLMNLIEQNANIYDTVNTVPIEDLLKTPTVIELNSIDNEEQKSLIMALLLINICVYTKHNFQGNGVLKNIMLIDEAHVLLSGGASKSDTDVDSKSSTIRALQNMIAEIRSYGTGIIIADQAPSKVSREIVANTDIKIAFRLVQSTEKELIADSTNMSEKAMQQLSGLKVGEAFVYYGKLEYPQMVITEDIREKERIRLSVPNSEVFSRNTYWDNRQKMLRPFRECELCSACSEGCDFKIRSKADYYVNKMYEALKNNITDKKTACNYVILIPQKMKKIIETDENFERLVNCMKNKMIRKIQLEKNIRFSLNEINRIIRYQLENNTDK